MAFTRPEHQSLFRATLSELRRLGYRGDLLRENYGFRDWFAGGLESRVAPAAAFGQTPVSYDTACIAVLVPGELSGVDLIRGFRALGAPLALEVRENEVVPWRVTRIPSSRDRLPAIRSEHLQSVLRSQPERWSPESVLRAKNIGRPTPLQKELFDPSLIPALEAEIREKLDPILRNALSQTQRDYGERTQRPANSRHLFQLAFWLLAGKVLSDRGVGAFDELQLTSSADDVLLRVARHYRERLPRLLDREARALMHRHVWEGLDYRNLSVEVLTHIWSTTLVTKELRQTLGIHSTPRAVAKYIVDRLPFEDVPRNERVVVEPCCGSATFLVAALQRLRDLLPTSLSGEDRHEYFKRMLHGIEREVFGIEVSRLCLTLADFPNPDGWALTEADVFASQHLADVVRPARFVLCNPPFEPFSASERVKRDPRYALKPAELLHRVLGSLSPAGMLGFVLPRQFIDGKIFRPIRRTVADRFEQVEIVSLPDSAFKTAGHETVILLASRPRGERPVPTGTRSLEVLHRTVSKPDWPQFMLLHRTSTDNSQQMPSSQASTSFAVPELAELWSFLSALPRLRGIAAAHRGIEWNAPLTVEGKETGNRERLVSSTPKRGFEEGYPPLPGEIHAFFAPQTRFLSMRPQDQRGKAYLRPWNRPKVFVNAATKSRGHWRIAAFADMRGLVCYQNLTAVWVANEQLIWPVSAILNGPIANAFVATREGKRHIRNRTLLDIPVPHGLAATASVIEGLVNEYLVSLSTDGLRGEAADERSRGLLERIDATVLDAYALPKRLERRLLDFFDGHRRAVPFAFERYFPRHYESVISLSDLLKITVDWDATNDRRRYLIEKKIARELDSNDAAELGRLQLYADERMRLVAPLPLQELEAIEERLLHRAELMYVERESVRV